MGRYVCQASGLKKLAPIADDFREGGLTVPSIYPEKSNLTKVIMFECGRYLMLSAPSRVSYT